MTFTNFFDAWFVLLAGSFVLALMLGFVAQKTSFCTMGALSDWFNFGDKDRLKAWVIAIGVAVIGVGVFEYYELVDVNQSYPNYRSSLFLYAENIIGGILFGVGMTYASGCGNKTLVRIGEGDFNSFIIMFAMSIAVYYSINPIPGTEETIYSFLFHEWIRPLSIELPVGQDITSLVGIILPAYNKESYDIIVYLLIGVGTISWGIMGNKSVEKIISGFVVGFCVSALWFLSNNIFIDYDDEKYTPSNFINEWEMVYEVPEDMDEDIDVATISPQNPNTFKSQSFTFVNPIGNTFGLVKAKVENTLSPEEQPVKANLFLNIGIMAVFGVIFGSFLSNIIFGKFIPKFNRSIKAIFNNMSSGILMGVGGTLSIGCTIGQGVTGLSTLSIGSVVTVLAIVFGSYCAQKCMIRFA